MRASEHPARHPPGVAPRQPFRQENPEPEDLDEAEMSVITADNGDVFVGIDPALNRGLDLEPQPTREPIDTVPKDGRDVRVYWGDDDDTGRLARWKPGRYFTGRRWILGGRWTPSDGLTPLTMDTPTHWLKPPGCPHDWLTVPREGNLAKCPECGAIQNLMHVSRSTGQIDPGCSDPVYDRPDEPAAA